MSDQYFSDWESLIDAANNKAKEILKTDVAPAAEIILKKHIKSDIYDAYTPKKNGWVLKTGGKTKSGKDKYIRATYERRNNLIDMVYSSMIGSNTLLITSSETANTPLGGTSMKYIGAFLELLESEDMGLWKGGFPRPAVSNAQSEIDKSSSIKSAIKKGIQREIGICKME